MVHRVGSVAHPNDGAKARRFLEAIPMLLTDTNAPPDHERQGELY